MRGKGRFREPCRVAFSVSGGAGVGGEGAIGAGGLNGAHPHEIPGFAMWLMPRFFRPRRDVKGVVISDNAHRKDVPTVQVEDVCD